MIIRNDHVSAYLSQYICSPDCLNTIFKMYSSRCICPDTFVIIIVQIFDFVRIYLWSQTAASCFSSGLTAARHSLEVIWEKVQSKLVSIHNTWQTNLKQSWKSFHSHNICLSESWNVFVATKLWQFPSPSAARHSQEARVIHSCLGSRDGTVLLMFF